MCPRQPRQTKYSQQFDISLTFVPWVRGVLYMGLDSVTPFSVKDILINVFLYFFFILNFAALRDKISLHLHPAVKNDTNL